MVVHHVAVHLRYDYESIHKERTDFMAQSFGQVISQLAQVNIALWHEEDHARTHDDQVVAQAKRRIDQLNQQRNFISKIKL